ncbi:hypothetical protein D2E60_21465 [Mycobacteroides abscessus]|nr:hypothetical protein D2E60_21465 [Mycobacteroides abscessus]
MLADGRSYEADEVIVSTVYPLMTACLIAAIVCSTSAGVPAAVDPPNQELKMLCATCVTLESALPAADWAFEAVDCAEFAVLRTPVMALNRLVMKLSLLPGLVPP